MIDQKSEARSQTTDDRVSGVRFQVSENRWQKTEAFDCGFGIVSNSDLRFGISDKMKHGAEGRAHSVKKETLE